MFRFEVTDNASEGSSRDVRLPRLSSCAGKSRVWRLRHLHGRSTHGDLLFLLAMFLFELVSTCERNAREPFVILVADLQSNHRKANKIETSALGIWKRRSGRSSLRRLEGTHEVSECFCCRCVPEHCHRSSVAFQRNCDHWSDNTDRLVAFRFHKGLYAAFSCDIVPVSSVSGG